MQFEWDEVKAAQNLAKHGVPLEYSAQVFLDPCRLDSEDRRHDYGEERRFTFGKVEGRIYAVAYTLRGETIRFISVRKANEREQRRYHETLST